MEELGKESRISSVRDRVQLMRDRMFYQTPASQIIAVLLVIFAIVIESGVIYILSEPTPLFFGEFGLVIPRTFTFQVASETLLVFLFILIGTIGIWMVRRAPVYVDDAERASLTQMVGIILFIAGFIFLYLFMVLKQYGNFNNLNIFG